MQKAFRKRLTVSNATYFIENEQRRWRMSLRKPNSHTRLKSQRMKRKLTITGLVQSQQKFVTSAYSAYPLNVFFRTIFFPDIDILYHLY